MGYLARHLHTLLTSLFLIRIFATFLFAQNIGELNRIIIWDLDWTTLAWHTLFDMNIWGLFYFLLCYWGLRIFNYAVNPLLSFIHLILIFFPVIFPYLYIPYLPLSSWLVFALNMGITLGMGIKYTEKPVEMDAEILDR